MLRRLAVTLLALLGDPSYLLRVWICVLLGFGLVALVCWLAFPLVLPLWPAVLVVAVSALIGVVWERYAAKI